MSITELTDLIKSMLEICPMGIYPIKDSEEFEIIWDDQGVMTDKKDDTIEDVLKHLINCNIRDADEALKDRNIEEEWWIEYHENKLKACKKLLERFQ